MNNLVSGVMFAAGVASFFLSPSFGQTEQQGASFNPEFAREIHFDGQKDRPAPTIPKSWKFIGVSSGEKPNSNNLWFQDSAGSIYMIRGFTSSGEFVLQPGLHALRVK
jgi:hypothetical protein